MLVEAQSTWTANIIVRALMYLAQTYHDYIAKEELNIYGSKTLDLPEPEMYVIYTGNKKIEKEAITLSEEFFGGRKTDLEVTVHVLTDGKEHDIIYQYVALTKVLDDQVKLHGRTREAIVETIRICKDRDLLKQYLTEHEQEVQDIMITLFDNETILKGYTREREKAAQTAEKMATVKKMLKKALPIDLISELSGLTPAEINAIKAKMAN